MAAAPWATTPNTTTVPPRRAMRSDCSKVSGTPAHSSTTSAPSGRAARRPASGSLPEGSTACVAPSARASSRRGACRVASTTVPAPAWRASSTISSPITPPPRMATEPPLGMRATSMAWRQQETGSQKAPCSGSSEAGSSVACPSGTSTYSAKPPSRWTPMALRFSQRLGRPLRHCRQRPQEMLGSPVIRAPGRKPCTSAPTASTMPENSCPSVTGQAVGNSPLNMCRSEPQTPQASTRTRRSPGPGTGRATSSTIIRPGVSSLAASIAVLPRWLAAWRKHR